MLPCNRSIWIFKIASWKRRLIIYDGKYIQKNYIPQNGQIKCLCFSSKVFHFGGEKGKKGRKQKHKCVPFLHVQTKQKRRTWQLDVGEFTCNTSRRRNTERKAAGLRLKAVQPSRAWKPYRYVQSLVWLCTADIQTQTVSLQQKQRSSSQVKRRISRCMQTQGSQTPLLVSALVSAITHWRCTSSLLILLLL